MFQYLIGCIQTVYTLSPASIPSKVSIPHRLHTNRFDVFDKRKIRREFQYLIGCIQTHSGKSNEFNEKAMFQYLIGCIQTPQQRSSGSQWKVVSIPHRLHTNIENTDGSYLKMLVSIPHRLHTNENHPWIKEEEDIFVSIPHRLHTNWGYYLELEAGGLEFQYLIGCIQTSCIII